MPWTTASNKLRKLPEYGGLWSPFRQLLSLFYLTKGKYYSCSYMLLKKVYLTYQTPTITVMITYVCPVRRYFSSVSARLSGELWEGRRLIASLQITRCTPRRLEFHSKSLFCDQLINSALLAHIAIFRHLGCVTVAYNSRKLSNFFTETIHTTTIFTTISFYANAPDRPWLHCML